MKDLQIFFHNIKTEIKLMMSQFFPYNMNNLHITPKQINE